MADFGVKLTCPFGKTWLKVINHSFFVTHEFESNDTNSIGCVSEVLILLPRILWAILQSKAIEILVLNPIGGLGQGINSSFYTIV